MADRLVTLAAVAGAHGIGGEVRLKLFSDGIEAISRHRQFDAGGRALSLKSIRPDKAGAIARFVEIADRSEAEKLRGTVLAVPRDALPPLAEGEYYHTDLIGLPCVSTTGEDLGHVVAVENYGAGDVVEIERPDGKSFMVPMSPQAVPEVGARLVVEAAFAA